MKKNAGSLFTLALYFSLCGYWALTQGVRLFNLVKADAPFQVAHILKEAGWKEVEVGMGYNKYTSIYASPRGGFKGATVYWGDEAASAARMRGTTLIKETEKIIILSDTQAVYLVDDENKDRLEIIEQKIRASVLNGKVSRKSIWHPIRREGKTKVRSSDVWFIPVLDAMVLLLEPGRLLLLSFLLLPPPGLLTVVIPIWMLLVVFLPVYLFAKAFQEENNTKTV